MALFPKVQSPCPIRSDLAGVMDGDTCTQCRRQVFDLTDLTDDQRVSFMADCVDEVCVSYRLPIRPALAAAAALATLAAPMAVAAQEAPAAEALGEIEVVVIVGGIKDLSKVDYVDGAEALAASDLPVVYEDAEAQGPDGAATPVTARGDS